MGEPNRNNHDVFEDWMLPGYIDMDNSSIDDLTLSQYIDTNNFNHEEFVAVGESRMPTLSPPVIESSSCTTHDRPASGQDSAIQASNEGLDTRASRASASTGFSEWRPQAIRDFREPSLQQQMHTAEISRPVRGLQEIDTDIEEMEVRLKLSELRREREQALRMSQGLQIPPEADFHATEPHFGASSIVSHPTFLLDSPPLDIRDQIFPLVSS
jgi:hypothetical protein